MGRTRPCSRSTAQRWPCESPSAPVGRRGRGRQRSGRRSTASTACPTTIPVRAPGRRRHGPALGGDRPVVVLGLRPAGPGPRRRCEPPSSRHRSGRRRRSGGRRPSSGCTGGCRRALGPLEGFRAGERAIQRCRAGEVRPVRGRRPPCARRRRHRRGPATGPTGSLRSMPVPEIDVHELARRRAEGAALLDVRNPDEWEGPVPGVPLIPLGRAAERVGGGPPEGARLLVICAAGARSAKAPSALPGGHGIDAVNVAGAWLGRRRLPRRTRPRVGPGAGGGRARIARPRRAPLDRHRGRARRPSRRAVGRAPSSPSTPSSTARRTYWPQVSVVQLGWPGGIALVDPRPSTAPLAPPLRPGPRHHHARRQPGPRGPPAHLRRVPDVLFDTQLAAGFLGYGTPSLASLVQGELGVKLPKGDRLTDWLRGPLGEDARTYAAGDVAHLLQLAAGIRRLEAGAGSAGRSTSARARPPPAPATRRAWWRVKEARSLPGLPSAWPRRRGRLAGAAGRRDRPAGAVRAARPRPRRHGPGPPTDLRALRRVRGLDERHLRGGAAELLEAVPGRRGHARRRLPHIPPAAGSTASCARPSRSCRPGSASWRVTSASTPRSWPPGHDLESLLRATRARLAAGWRAEAVGDAIRDLVAGEAALAFDGRSGLVLEPRSGRALATEACAGRPRVGPAAPPAAARPARPPRPARLGPIAGDLDHPARARPGPRRRPSRRGPAGGRPRPALPASTPSPASTAPGADVQGRRRLAGGEQPLVEPQDRRWVVAEGLHRPGRPRAGTGARARPPAVAGAGVQGIGARQPSRPPGSTRRSAGPRRPRAPARRRRTGTACRAGRAGARRPPGPRPRRRSRRADRRWSWLPRAQVGQRPRLRVGGSIRRGPTATAASPHGRCRALKSKARCSWSGPL